MNHKIIIRLARPADAPAMAEIHARSWEVAYKNIIPEAYIKEKSATCPALWQRIITDENTSRYVIETGGKIVGFLHIDPPQDDDLDDSFCELHAIYLHPDIYRQGIGSQAMEFAYGVARNLGKTSMILWVFAENTNTIKFYEKCGFVADGKTKTHDCGKIMQCIRMRHKL